MKVLIGYIGNVNMPYYQTSREGDEHPIRVTLSLSLLWAVNKYAGLWRAVYATERRLGTIREEKGIPSQIQISILSRYDLN